MAVGSRNDRGSALVFAAWLMATAALGAVAIPKAVAVADNVVARVDLVSAAHLIAEYESVVANKAELSAMLRADDPGLGLSGTALAGRPVVVPGSMGVAIDGRAVILAMSADGRCYRAVVLEPKIDISVSKTARCAA